MKTIIRKISLYLLSAAVITTSSLSLAAPALASEDTPAIEEEIVFLDAEEELAGQETVEDITALETEEDIPETEAALEEIEALEADEEDISGQENGFEVIEPEDAEDEAAPADEFFIEPEEDLEEMIVEEANASWNGTIENLTWTLNNGVLTISGNGEMNVGSPAPWQSYRSLISQVVIGNGVTSISSYAFNGCSGISRLTLGSSVKRIGYAAFGGCTGLTSLTIPASVETLSESAFNGCRALRELNLNNGLKKIGTSAFCSCFALREVKIPATVTTIESHAFLSCESLAEIVVPDSVTSLGFNAFDGCTSLKKAVLGNGISKISSGLFHNCPALTSVTMPDSVTVIEGAAFRDCTSLKSIALSKNLTTIGSESFYGCSSLTSVVIPDLVTRINGSAFGACSSLTVVSLPAYLQEIGVNAFYGTPLSTVFYLGTPSDWDYINILSGNSALTDADRIYGSLMLSAPKISITNVVKSGKPKISWKKVTGAGSYQIYRATSKNGSYTRIKTVTGTAYTDTTAAANKTYYYKVKAKIGTVSSSFSNIAGKTCKCARPEITLKLNSSKKAVISWNAVSGAKSYTVYRATSKTGTYKAVKTLTAKKWTDTSVSKGKKYYYKVRANGSSSSANSAYSTVKGISVK